MSKALKVIIGVILAAFIAAGAGLVIPQFTGTEMVIVQKETVSNLPVGTVIYTEKADSSTMQSGDKLVDLDVNRMYLYTVKTYDSRDCVAEVTGGVQDTIKVSDTFTKVKLTLPLIGYLSIATGTQQGLIILGGMLLLLIILFVFSEIMRRGELKEYGDEDDADDDEEDEEEDGFYNSLAAKKAESDARYDTGVIVKNLGSDDDADNGADETDDGNTEGENSGSSEADEADQTDSAEQDSEETEENADGMTELGVAATDDDDLIPAELTEEKVETGALPDVQAALEAALENQPLTRQTDMTTEQYLEPDTEGPETDVNGEIELAMPVHSADEYLQKAYSEGLDPTVEEDEATGVTLIDFSDCL